MLIRRLEEYAQRIDFLIWTVLLVDHTRIRKELLLLYSSYHQFVGQKLSLCRPSALHPQEYAFMRLYCLSWAIQNFISFVKPLPFHYYCLHTCVADPRYYAMILKHGLLLQPLLLFFKFLFESGYLFPDHSYSVIDKN